MEQEECAVQYFNFDCGDFGHHDASVLCDGVNSHVFEAEKVIFSGCPTPNGLRSNGDAGAGMSQEIIDYEVCVASNKKCAEDLKCVPLDAIKKVEDDAGAGRRMEMADSEVEDAIRTSPRLARRS